MRILVDRFLSDRLATIAQVTVYADADSAVMGCYTCEDAYNVPKIPGKTRIPAGVYTLGFRKGSPMHKRYMANPRLNGIGQERGMLWVRNIPDFEYVYFHIGNGPQDTEGCPLVGDGFTRSPLGVINSVKTYKKFYPLVANAIEAVTVTAEFRDNDRSQL